MAVDCACVARYATESELMAALEAGWLAPRRHDSCALGYAVAQKWTRAVVALLPHVDASVSLVKAVHTDAVDIVRVLLADGRFDPPQTVFVSRVAMSFLATGRVAHVSTTMVRVLLTDPRVGLLQTWYTIPTARKVLRQRHVAVRFWAAVVI